MPSGLQVFNDDGSIRDDVTTRFSRIVKRVYIPTKEWPRSNSYNRVVLPNPLLSGSFTVPEFADWSPFYFFSGGEYAPSFPPDVFIDGTTLRWEIWPRADIATFEEAKLTGFKSGKISSYAGGFWLNVGVY